MTIEIDVSQLINDEKDKCPFCFSPRNGTRFSCGYPTPSNGKRTSTCYERQIAALEAEIIKLKTEAREGTAMIRHLGLTLEQTEHERDSLKVKLRDTRAVAGMEEVAAERECERLEAELENRKLEVESLGNELTRTQEQLRQARELLTLYRGLRQVDGLQGRKWDARDYDRLVTKLARAEAAYAALSSPQPQSGDEESEVEK